LASFCSAHQQSVKKSFY